MTGHRTSVRRFEFDLGVGLGAAVDVIETALEDEGLVLTDGGQLQRITSVIQDGRMVVLVPDHRITTAERSN